MSPQPAEHDVDDMHDLRKQFRKLQRKNRPERECSAEVCGSGADADAASKYHGKHAASDSVSRNFRVNFTDGDVP